MNDSAGIIYRDGKMKKKTRNELAWSLVLKQEDILRKKYGREEFAEQFAFFLAEIPSEKCRRCFGRGNIGRDIVRRRVIPCSCVKSGGIKKAEDAEEGQILMRFDGEIYIEGKKHENDKKVR